MGIKMAACLEIIKIREELSDESCPFCGARTEKLYEADALVATRCIQCAYANWEV